MTLIGHGDIDRLVWRDDLPVPVPGPGEVLIKVGASAVNNTDINLRTGWYARSVRSATAAAGAAEEVAAGGWSGETLTFPRIQGADCCGRIVQVGPSVNRGRIGARVLVRALQPVRTADGSWTTRTLGTDYDGAFADYVVVPERDAVAIRSALSDLELASFPCSYSTAEAMLQRAGLGAERVLVTGASGGVGSAAIQLAVRRGAQVVAVAGAAKAQAVKALGAAEVLPREVAIPEGAFDVVVDVVGGPRWAATLAGLRRGGRYVVSGAIAGPIVELDLRTLYLRDLALLGSTHQPENVFLDLVGYIEAGDLLPVIADIFPLHDLAAAQQAFLTKRHVGKIAITVAEQQGGSRTFGHGT